MRKTILVRSSPARCGVRSRWGLRRSAGLLGGGERLVRLIGTAAGSNFDVYPFAFKVRVDTDGSASGSYRYTQRRDGVELNVSGPLTCATIAGNRAWVGGVIEETNRESLLGLDMWFQVQDNGDRSRLAAPTCRRRSAPAGRARRWTYCVDAPPVMLPVLRLAAGASSFSG